MDIRRDWAELSGYDRFEAFVAFTLTLVVGIVILLALYRLIVSVLDELLLKTLNPLEPAVFQHVFGSIMTLLIALEFNHTLRYVVTRDRGIIQVEVVGSLPDLGRVGIDTWTWPEPRARRKPVRPEWRSEPAPPHRGAQDASSPLRDATRPSWR